MHNYKVGDLVTVIHAESESAPAELSGKTGKIDLIWDDGNLDVEFADDNVWSFTPENVRPADVVYIVVDADDEITAEHRSLEEAEKDARSSAAYCAEVFTVYQRIVSFGVKTEVVETRG